MKRWTIGIALAVGILAGTLQVRADDFAFGGSGGIQNLTLTFSGGGSSTLNTGQSLLFPLAGQSENQGWWSPTDGNNLGNTNYIVGNLTAGTTVFNFNDFFTFDLSLSALPSGQTVTGAVLSVVPFSVVSTTGQSQEIVSFFDVSTDATTLNNLNNSPNAAIFADLGSGKLYGTYAFPIGTSGTYANVILNANAVADINAAIAAIPPTGGPEYFSIGGTLSPISPIPEPATLIIWSLLGGLGIAVAHWRRRKSA